MSDAGVPRLRRACPALDLRQGYETTALVARESSRLVVTTVDAPRHDDEPCSFVVRCGADIQGAWATRKAAKSSRPGSTAVQTLVVGNPVQATALSLYKPERRPMRSTVLTRAICVKNVAAGFFPPIRCPSATTKSW